MARPPRHVDEGTETDPIIADPPYIGTERAVKRARDSGNGGDGGGVESIDILAIRVSHLETRMIGLETKLDNIIEKLGAIATRPEMRNYVFLAIGSFIALVAILVGSMGWLETRATRLQPVAPTAAMSPAPQPIIIQVPYPAPNKPR